MPMEKNIMTEEDLYMASSRGATVQSGTEGELCCCARAGGYKLGVFDWLEGLHASPLSGDIVEIRFKNTRKAYYKNVNNLPLKIGDLVAVEASPGHDIGLVSLTGDLVHKQLERYNVQPDRYEFKKIYRIAKSGDIEKWQEAIAAEHRTMIRSRQIAADLNLNMKIGDVEYQGDKTKAIFYYIADERVDFRELIRVLADSFKVRIEMRQIGARQEAGRIGGISTCGRELCCTRWVCSFASVTTGAARQQEIAINQQKLAGQCGKLKCCLNFELATYVDASKDFPKTLIALETMEGTAYHQKTDVLKRIFWYSFDKHSMERLTAVPVERVKEILMCNKKGIKVDKLIEDQDMPQVEEAPDYRNAVGDDSITRFDATKKKKKKKSHRKKA